MAKGTYSLSERRQRETQMTRQEAVAWAEEFYAERRYWPSRRYRLEGTAAGNSRLLTAYGVDQSRRRYGGRAVELIPTRVKYLEEFHGIKRMTPNRELAQDLAACPRCGAAAGEPCVRVGTTEMRKPHSKRRLKEQAA